MYRRANGFRLVAAVVLTLVIAALAGCASRPQTSPAPTGKPTELAVLAWPGTRPALDAAIDAYTKKHPGVSIRGREPEFGNLFDQQGRLNKAVLEGMDIAFLPDYVAMELAAESLLRNLSAVKLTPRESLAAPLYDDLSQVDGKRIMLPFELTPATFLANDKQFAKAGLKPPVDWTVQEFEQALIALKTAGNLPKLETITTLDGLVGSFGGHMSDPSGQIVTLDSPEVREGLAYVARLVQGQLLNPVVPEVFEMMSGPDAPALTPLMGPAVIRIGQQLQPYPKGPKGRSVPVFATGAVALSASAHPEAAMDFLKALVNDEEVQSAMAQVGIRPVAAGSRALEAWRSAMGDRNAQAIELSLTGAHARTFHHGREIAEGLAPFFTGARSLDQVLPALEATLK